MAPEVTVVIPTRNRWALLSRALETALAQEDVALEVIVVDDASVDETPVQLAEIRHPAVRVIRQRVRGGVAKARNAGVQSARGRWLAFLDDDDLWSPRKLRLQLDCAESAQASFAYSAVVDINEAGDVLHLVPAPDPETIARRLLIFNAVPGGGSNAIAETELLRGLGGFDERLSVMADWDLWIRSTQTSRAAACPDALVAYRQHRGSMSLDEDYDALSEFTYLAAKHRELSERLGVPFGLSGRVLYRHYASRYRLAGRRFRASLMYLRVARIDRSRADLGRALGVLLGERALRAGACIRDRGRRKLVTPPAATPAWLDRYANLVEPESRMPARISEGRESGSEPWRG